MGPRHVGVPRRKSTTSDAGSDSDDSEPHPIPAPGRTEVQVGERKVRNHQMRKDSVHLVRCGDCEYVVSESYFYKSDAYYTIVQSEMSERKVFPRSADMVDAYNVPICLTRSSAEGIPVCDWDISYIYAPAPCIIYGINYFSDPAQYSVLTSPEEAEEMIKHVTNNGKYPFCYQRIAPGVEIVNHVVIFGRGAWMDSDAQAIAAKLFDLFHIPIMNMVLMKSAGECRLSALTPVSYSKLSAIELNTLIEGIG